MLFADMGACENRMPAPVMTYSTQMQDKVPKTKRFDGRATWALSTAFTECAFSPGLARRMLFCPFA
jgi:hypothetical protein